MFEDALSAAIRLVRGYTAVRAWAVEVLAVFVLFTVGRFGLAVWMFDMAASGAGAGYVPGWVPAAAAVGLVAGEAGVGAGGGPWWVAWLYAYDNLRSYAENAIIAGVILAFVFEGVVMFLARKRIRISKEEGHAAGHAAGREEGRAEALAEVQPQLETMQAENRLLRERQDLQDVEIRLMRERQELRDEEVRFLREQLALRENGGGNGGNGNGG